jgi:hypothetical protein
MKTQHRFHGLSKGNVVKRGQGLMNKTEARYAAMLEEMVQRSEIVKWWFEPFSLRLTSPDAGRMARYTPDFLLLYPDGETVVVDVKGDGVNNEASIVRAKCAAEMFFLWHFWFVTWSKGEWHTQKL